MPYNIWASVIAVCLRNLRPKLSSNYLSDTRADDVAMPYEPKRQDLHVLDEACQEPDDKPV